MEQVLSLSARPQTFDGLVGQQKTVESIRRRWAKKRMPKAFLFFGPLGCGKTTLARILALSLQCQHQGERFGIPCMECRRLKAQFMIEEISAADVGTEKLKDSLSTCFLNPMGLSTYRIYILDEPQGMHVNSQRHMLKLLEDAPPTTIFILCTTEPHKLLDTLRSRCAAYELRGLDSDEILKLVTRLLKKLDSDLPADRLTDALIDRGLSYPRWIAQAVERYVSDGGEINDASAVDAAQTVAVDAFTKAMTKGQWPTTIAYLAKAQATDARPIRLGMIRYLRGILLNSDDISERTQVVVDAIQALSNVPTNAEDIVVAAALAACTYNLCVKMEEYKF